MFMYYYSIFDRKAKSFGDLLAFPSNETEAAIRWFRDIAMDENPKNYIRKYPGDFDLFYLGKFDKQTGDFVSVSDEDPIGIASLSLNKGFICNASLFFGETPYDVIA